MDLYFYTDELNTNKLSTSGGAMTGKLEMATNSLSFSKLGLYGYQIANDSYGRLMFAAHDGTPLMYLQQDQLWLVNSGKYAFFLQPTDDGRLFFCNHDGIPIMSISYAGDLRVRGSITQNVNV